MRTITVVRQIAWLALASAGISAGCGDNPAPVDTPASYTLAPEVRSKLREGVDTIRLIKLLARLSPQEQKYIEKAFQRGVSGAVRIHSQKPEVDAELNAIYDAEHRARQARVDALVRVWGKPVRLAVVKDPANRLEVVRNQGSSGEDIIVLGDSVARVVELSAALHALAQNRAKHGVHLASFQRGVVKVRRPDATMPPSWRSRVQGYLDEVLRAPEVNVPGIGPARSITFNVER